MPLSSRPRTLFIAPQSRASPCFLAPLPRLSAQQQRNPVGMPAALGNEKQRLFRKLASSCRSARLGFGEADGRFARARALDRQRFGTPPKTGNPCGASEGSIARLRAKGPSWSRTEVRRGHGQTPGTTSWPIHHSSADKIRFSADRPTRNAGNMYR